LQQGSGPAPSSAPALGIKTGVRCQEAKGERIEKGIRCQAPHRQEMGKTLRCPDVNSLRVGAGHLVRRYGS